MHFSRANQMVFFWKLKKTLTKRVQWITNRWFSGNVSFSFILFRLAVHCACHSKQIYFHYLNDNFQLPAGHGYRGIDGSVPKTQSNQIKNFNFENWKFENGRYDRHTHTHHVIPQMVPPLINRISLETMIAGDSRKKNWRHHNSNLDWWTNTTNRFRKDPFAVTIPHSGRCHEAEVMNAVGIENNKNSVKIVRTFRHNLSFQHCSTRMCAWTWYQANGVEN